MRPDNPTGAFVDYLIPQRIGSLRGLFKGVHVSVFEKRAMFVEFPKSLYKGDQLPRRVSEHLIVSSAEEEAGARLDGWRMLTDPRPIAPSSKVTTRMLNSRPQRNRVDRVKGNYHACTLHGSPMPSMSNRIPGVLPCGNRRKLATCPITIAALLVASGSWAPHSAGLAGLQVAGVSDLRSTNSIVPVRRPFIVLGGDGTTAGMRWVRRRDGTLP